MRLSLVQINVNLWPTILALSEPKSRQVGTPQL